MKWRAIVLDFDGVILESAAIKGRAFRGLFPDYPQHLDRFEQFHYDNGGLSRHLKIAWFYRELLGRPVTREAIDRLADRFGAVVAGDMRACPFVDGAVEFLERYADRVLLFVASGTPEPELRELVAARGLALRFAGVFGAPATKVEILTTIASQLGIAPEELLFVGDGRQDAEAARETRVTFVGRVATGDSDRLGDVPVARVANLFELDQYLTPLMDAHR